MTEYLLDNAWQQQRQRLAGLEAWFDPGTKRYLEQLEVGNGWCCLEVGGGGGSIAEWLCQRVGPNGRVVATDLDTRFLDVLDAPNLEVRHHNILTDELPAGRFDLVHARFLVEHLPERMTALRHMSMALKPGGWLLVEDTDSSSWLPDPTVDAEAAALFNKWTAAYIHLCRSTEADANAGRRLYGEFHALGLVEVGAEGRVFMVRGGSPNAEVWYLTAEQVQDRIVEGGLLTTQEMKQLLALLMNPEFVWMEGLIMACWGRLATTS
jgi:2-polyprenyl-3-methyl-5-hydroxy-6-metoxy-1,4-benzoquinol methylase